MEPIDTPLCVLLARSHDLQSTDVTRKYLKRGKDPQPQEKVEPEDFAKDPRPFHHMLYNGPS